MLKNISPNPLDIPWLHAIKMLGSIGCGGCILGTSDAMTIWGLGD